MQAIAMTISNLTAPLVFADFLAKVLAYGLLRGTLCLSHSDTQPWAAMAQH